MNGILAFHDLDSRLHAGITNVSPQAFDRHLDWMLARGYSFCSLADPLTCRTDPGTISVTFDDAMESQLEAALPRLIEHHIKATAFVITSYVGKPATWDYRAGSGRHADWTMLREWTSAGMHLGSHSCTHRDLRKLTASALVSELVTSRAILEDHVQESVTQIAYPFGRFNDRVLKTAADAGYLRGVTTRAALSFDNPLALPRVLVSRLDTSLAIELRLGSTVWGKLERIKQSVVGAWAGGTIRYQQLRGDYKAIPATSLPSASAHLQS